MDSLIERLKERARDPKRGVDERTARTEHVTAALPVSGPAVLDVEADLGFRLPALLRRIYTDVAGGGFGPGYGLYAIPTGPGAKLEDNLVARYEQWRSSQKSPRWPLGLLPLCEWGSGIASFVDCISPDGPVIRLDPNMPKKDADERIPEALRYSRADQVKEACWIESPSIQLWLTSWVDDVKLFYAAYRRPGEDDDLEDDEEDDGDDE